ncbi:LD-carboxypeptidase [filamentous cyanobacterium LEGE 11480]|uniref:LD-carboxypeptidase n=1 Tax=Romeriopsis navalis LEGE 11480 TaxID=2777977 RepID=A0A928VLX9_9CYAN|nr:LD-carboxypeptidase [Romeriopsis navalis]MBE9030057.1 LD-carboxypeptidase [Romeriopsis navalis LEGE 11480]
MRSCQLPPPLQPGDLLRVIAPSGALRERAALDQGVEIWRSRGYRVEFVAGYGDRWGYLAGTDAARRAQLQTALTDPECKGILCLRGGWGGSRLLEDWMTLQPPAMQLPDGIKPESLAKWLVGFSDITSLLWAFSQFGVAGLHAPLLTTIAHEPDWSLQRLFDCVAGKPLPTMHGNGWGGGKATGLLLPANLTVATHLLGTPIQPALDGVILAIEDVGEAPYRLDRLLTHWRMSGALQNVAGIALGRFSQCQAPAGYESLSIEEVLRDRLGDLGLPIVADLPFGHDGENGVLPVGLSVELDAAAGTLSFC